MYNSLLLTERAVERVWGSGLILLLMIKRSRSWVLRRKSYHFSAHPRSRICFDWTVFCGKVFIPYFISLLNNIQKINTVCYSFFKDMFCWTICIVPVTWTFSSFHKLFKVPSSRRFCVNRDLKQFCSHAKDLCQSFDNKFLLLTKNLFSFNLFSNNANILNKYSLRLRLWLTFLFSLIWFQC